jgi:L-seryl-tRNA(Ser) seleniumtransferase
VDDLGSGALIDLSKYGLPKEPLVQESVAAGADVVCFSGDKLIAACQAGIIVGAKRHIDALKKHPLTRALRCGKLTYAVLERTLELFLDEERAVKEHSLLQVLLKPVAEIQRGARAFVRRTGAKLGDRAALAVRPARGEIGGGSLATESIESRVVAVKPGGVHVDELARRMRLYDVPVFGRVEKDEYLLDFRTIRKDETRIVADALLAALP